MHMSFGVGKFCPCIGRSDDFIYMYHGGIVATFLPACQNIESFAAGRCIRTESRIEYKTCPSACHYLFGSIGSYCYRILRSDYFSGAGRSASLQGMFRTSDHRILMPASLLAGASLALVCNLIARMPGFEGALPVNSVTALVGAPVVMSVLFNKRRNEMNE